MQIIGTSLTVYCCHNYFKCCYNPWRDGLAHGLDERRFVQFLAGARFQSFPQRFQTSSGAHPAYYLVSSGSSFLLGGGGGSQQGKVTNHLYLAWLRRIGVYLHPTICLHDRTSRFSTNVPCKLNGWAATQ
jgi:hypothetical protein